MRTAQAAVDLRDPECSWRPCSSCVFAVGPFPLALVINDLELGTILLAVLIAHVVTHEGESTWFEGLRLLDVCGVLGLVFFFA